MTTQVAVRLDEDQLRRIDRARRRLKLSRSEVIRRALDLYLYRLECERDASVYARAPLTDKELALVDDEEAWRGTPSW